MERHIPPQHFSVLWPNSFDQLGETGDESDHAICYLNWQIQGQRRGLEEVVQLQLELVPLGGDAPERRLHASDGRLACSSALRARTPRDAMIGIRPRHAP